MQAFTSRALAERLGIGKDLAAKILALPSAPAPAKFHAEASYLRKLARAAIRAGHTHDALAALSASVAPRQADAASGPADTPARPPARDPTPPQDGDVTMADLQTTASNLRAIVSGLGDAIAEAIRHNHDLAAVVPLLDKFKGMQAEFRQTVEKLEELRREHLELLPRADVYAAAGRMFQTIRGFADALTGDMLNAGNLPAWLAQAGGVFPESAIARQSLRMALRRYSEQRYIALADALADMAVPLDSVDAGLSDELRAEMAAELDRCAAALRRQRIPAQAMT